MLQDGSKVTIRPSGTEPKVKIYCEVIQAKFIDVKNGLKEAEAKALKYIDAMQAILKDTAK